jgi:hypothetical protein
MTYDDNGLSKADLERVIRRHKNGSKVGELESFDGGHAVWLREGWTWDADDGNRSVAHYHTEGQSRREELATLKSELDRIEIERE